MIRHFADLGAFLASRPRASGDDPPDEAVEVVRVA